MSQFLLAIEDRLVHVKLEDEKGDDRTIPALVTATEPSTTLLPTPPPIHFPKFPQGLRPLEVHELTLDTSELPRGVVPFSLEEFARRAHEMASSEPTTIRLGPEEARAWGLQESST